MFRVLVTIAPLALLLAGCSNASAPARNADAPLEVEPNLDAANMGGTPAQESAEPTAGAPSGAALPPTEGPPPGAQSLPAVRVRNIGLHVGGGPNDAAGKVPFIEALERQFPEFLRCYALANEPGQGGSFGVDLHIPASGGVPRVEQPRTGLVGDEFRECMVAAFSRVQFERPRKAVVVSYSLRFSVEP